MDRTTAKACFSRLMKQNSNNSSWKRAVSWLFHSEPEQEVIETFCLTDKEFVDASQAVNILHNQRADYDRVHAWATKD
jgi:hypothetical protein